MYISLFLLFGRSDTKLSLNSHLSSGIVNFFNSKYLFTIKKTPLKNSFKISFFISPISPFPEPRFKFEPPKERHC